ncbi:MAG: nitrogenase component 1, partial [Campylobacterales bacterium]
QKALIDQLVDKSDTTDCSIATILPNVNISPIEVEKLKEFVNNFGFLAYALPDISTALDGHLGKKQGQVAQGGIKKDNIKSLAKSSIVISIGDSTKRSAKALMKKNPNIKHIHLDSIHGLDSSDKLASELINIKNIKPPKSLRRWRERLQDIYLDSHFLMGKTKVAIALEADEAYGVAKLLAEVGATTKYIFTPTKSGLDFSAVCQSHSLGDLEDLEKIANEVDILITNSHGKSISKNFHKPLLLRGFPDYDNIGVGLKNDILYEGGCYLLKSIVSSLKECE